MNDASEKAREILQIAFDQQATDLHFHPRSSTVTLHLRILGQRKLFKELSPKEYEQLLLYFKFSSDMDISKKNFPQNGKMEVKCKSKKRYFLRLSTLPSKPSESLAIRILPQYEEYSKNHLFLFNNQFRRMLSWFLKDSGLILFSGKTGSGKTTTMYTLLQTIVERYSLQAITLENPIEKDIPNLIQLEINQTIGFTYKVGLQAVLRHDPDIILIGEILDAKTAKFAVHAALTGHIVLSTIHAKNLVETIERLLAMRIKEIDLKQTLLGIVSLQLIPIQSEGNIQRRAAIAEMLYGEDLKKFFTTKKAVKTSFKNFNQLRRKAYAYGFLSEKHFFKT